MLLVLNKEEMAILIFHMSLMRKNVRKGFKSNLGKTYKEALFTYDKIKETVNEALESSEEFDQTLDFEIKEIDMLLSFLEFYINELKHLATDRDNNLIYLDNIFMKAQKCKVA